MYNIILYTSIVLPHLRIQSRRVDDNPGDGRGKTHFSGYYCTVYACNPRVNVRGLHTHGRKVSSPEKTRCTMISSGSKKQHFWCVRWQMAMHTSRASRFPRRFRQTRLVLFVFHAWRIIIYRRRAKRDTPRSEEFEKISRRFVHISLSMHSYAYLYIGTSYSYYS